MKKQLFQYNYLKKHNGIIFGKRNKKEHPYLLHNAGWLFYEEDALARYKIIGYFKMG